MRYKGFTGTYSYDDINKVFTGEVIQIRSVITFHGNTVDELEYEFHISVDDYLDWCRQDGVTPFIR